MFKTFEKNYAGRDFVVGDIHGCFSLLEKELEEINFNYNTDRLFSVGDLVDRGPESERCIEFLEKPWFHAILGNHEVMVMQYFDNCWPENNYILNGGEWFVKLDQNKRDLYNEVFKLLPYAIEIQDTWNTGKVGLVHAECPVDGWDNFKSQLLMWETREPDFDIQECVWARKRINKKDESIVAGINHIFVGHTPVNKPSRLGNHIYIDTGAVFGRYLTIIQL